MKLRKGKNTQAGDLGEDKLEGLQKKCYLAARNVKWCFCFTLSSEGEHVTKQLSETKEIVWNWCRGGTSMVWELMGNTGETAVSWCWFRLIN